MNHLFTYIIPGISDGSIYAICALGLVLTYKTSGVFNFAHGPVAAAAAYAFYQFRDRQHLPWPIAALLALILIGVIGGVLLERLANALSDAPTVMRVVATVGLLVGLDSGLTAHYGQATILFAHYLPQSGFHLSGVKVTGENMIQIALALGATGGLYAFFKKARMGVAMQAVVADPTLLGVMGISPVKVRRLAWTLGSSFAAISGMLFATQIGINVSDLILLAIAAYSAAAIGLFSSLPLTLLGGMIVGVGTNLLPDFLPQTTNTTIQSLPANLPFMILFAMLVLAPKGRLIESGISRARRLHPPVQIDSRVMTGGAGALAALGLAIPYLVPAYDLNQYSNGIAYAVILASLALVTWTSGQLSLCQLGFAAVGVTTFARALSVGFPWLLALMVAAAVAVPVGAILAIPAIRLSGIYLAIATFGFGVLLQRLVYPTFLMFGLNDSLRVPRPRFFGLSFRSDKGYYYLCLAVMLVCFAVIVTVRRSRLGRLLRGLADSPIALAAHGANTRATRTIVFCISAALAAIGGALIGGVTGSASGIGGGTFDFSNSLVFVAVLAFCGRRALVSPLLAAFLYEVLRVYPFFKDAWVVRWEGVAFGAMAIGVAIAPRLGSLRGTEGREPDRRRSPVAARFEPVIDLRTEGVRV